MQAAVKRRDTEIQRLAVRAEQGPDPNQLNLRFKNETNESIILQLHSQVKQASPTLPTCQITLPMFDGPATKHRDRTLH